VAQEHCGGPALAASHSAQLEASVSGDIGCVMRLHHELDCGVHHPVLLSGIILTQEGSIYVHGCALIDLDAQPRVEFCQTTCPVPLFSEQRDGAAIT